MSKTTKSNKLTETIKQLLNDGGYIEGIKFVRTKNQPPEAKFIFKKLTAKEIAFFQNQLTLLKNPDSRV